MTATQNLNPAPDDARADDHVGGIETAGVEYLPEEARDSSPRTPSGGRAGGGERTE
jgi:hypothetical protein